MSLQINPTPQIGLTNAGQAQGITQKGPGGGDGTGNGNQVRADWNVRMNVRHESGFVGGAARMLFHNLVAEERTEIVLYLPARHPATLNMQSAVVCSAKPGTPATAGQSLAFRVEGSRTIITIPMMRMNDWMYIDLTWTGAFPTGGMSFPGAQVPLGEFHPQLTIETRQADNRVALALVTARYDVEVESDPGARIVIDDADAGTIATEMAPDGRSTIHRFQTHGHAAISARLAPPGSLAGAPVTPGVPF